MKAAWKVMLAVTAVLLLGVVTQPLWRYRVWLYKGTVPVFLRYDRLTGDVQCWGGGHWQKYSD